MSSDICQVHRYRATPRAPKPKGAPSPGRRRRSLAWPGWPRRCSGKAEAQTRRRKRKHGPRVIRRWRGRARYRGQHRMGTKPLRRRRRPMFFAAEMAICLGVIVFVLTAAVLFVAQHRKSTHQGSASADHQTG